MTDSLPAAIRPRFQAFAEAVLPAVRAYGPDDWVRAEAVVARALGERPAPAARQVRLFLAILDWLTVPAHGRRFGDMPAEEREAFVCRLQRFPVLAVRRGVWGLRTLAFMGHYARPEVHPALGYGARPGGWAERRGAAPAEPEA